MQPACPAPVAVAPGETKWGGLLRGGHHWRLTRRGWAVVVLLVLVAGAIFLRGIHPFLAVSKPVPSQVLVVEGWVADYAIDQGVREFDRGGYSAMYVTGGPIERGAPLAEYKTYAALGAAVAVFFGVPSNQVHAVPAPKVRRDRTLASAMALRDWLEAHEGVPPALNLVSVGPHSRRSRLLFEKVFDGRCQIGVIAVEDEEYDPRRWWTYSRGVRVVMSETVAYLYARLFFAVSADREQAEKESGEDSIESSP